MKRVVLFISFIFSKKEVYSFSFIEAFQVTDKRPKFYYIYIVKETD